MSVRIQPEARSQPLLRISQPTVDEADLVNPHRCLSPSALVGSSWCPGGVGTQLFASGIET
jgi:hypothetical protein